MAELRTPRHWISIAGLVATTAASIGLIGAALRPSVAHAESNKDAARDHFKKGAAAVEAGRFAEGETSLQAAERLFHAPTHLLWIARAQAGQEHFVAARETYRALLSEPLGPAAPPAFVSAVGAGKSELDALLQKMPKVQIKVTPKAAAGLTTTLNGAKLSNLEEPALVDPGEVVVTAKADDYTPLTVRATAKIDTTIGVELLLQERPKTEPTTEPPEPKKSPVKPVGVTLAAAGGASLVGAGVMIGLHFDARSKADDLYASCPTCKADVVAEDDAATLYGNLGIGLGVAGGVLAATGIVLIAVAPDEDSTASRTTSTFSIGPSNIAWTLSF